jgi:hypothetical protein
MRVVSVPAAPASKELTGIICKIWHSVKYKIVETHALRSAQKLDHTPIQTIFDFVKGLQLCY